MRQRATLRTCMTPSLQEGLNTRRVHGRTPESLWPSVIHVEGMEHLWSPAGATGGNRWQMRHPKNRSNKPIRNRWQPTATVSQRMVRRGSTVRVRQRALFLDELPADRWFLLPGQDTVEHLRRKEGVDAIRRDGQVKTPASGPPREPQQLERQSGDRFWGQNWPQKSRRQRSRTAAPRARECGTTDCVQYFGSRTPARNAPPSPKYWMCSM
jgi:hypothetical protein